MPYSPTLLVGLLVACAALRVAFALRYGLGPPTAVANLVGGLATVGAVYLLLRWRDKPARFVQTATAMAAVAALFDLVEFPLVSLVPIRQILEHPGERMALGAGQALAALAISALGIWQWCVWIHTLRRALDTVLPGAILAFLGLVVVALVATLVGGSLAGLA